VLPEFNLINGQVDVMFRSYPGARVRLPINQLFELKRVPKSASEAEFQSKFEEGITQMKGYLVGEYQQWTGVVVCFRGNLDFKIEII